MERYRHFMVDGGMIHLKTDSNFLFTYTTLMVEKNRLPVDFKTEDLYHDEQSAMNVDPATLAVQTYYEQMWIARGLNIKYMRWHLPGEGLLEEPDVEIELDEYRSYHRTKRSSLDKAK
jgi:tRNA (guanine-N7-)-methyltransferase